MAEQQCLEETRPLWGGGGRGRGQGGHHRRSTGIAKPSPGPGQDIGPGGPEEVKGKDLFNLPESSRADMGPESHLGHGPGTRLFTTPADVNESDPESDPESGPGH